jgi:molybdenum cofactor cytidylyltransferase
MIDCILPAAGLSQRMGRWKPLLPLFNKTIIEWSVFNAIAGGCKVILVTGPNTDQLQKIFKNNKLVTLIRNRSFSDGLITSIKTGLSVVKTDRFFVSLADMPFILPNIYQKISAYQSNVIVFPTYENKPGHPVLIPSDFINKIYQYQGNKGLKPLLLSLPHQFVEVSTQGIRFDIDTPEEYQKAILQAESILNKEY